MRRFGSHRPIKYAVISPLIVSLMLPLTAATAKTLENDHLAVEVDDSNGSIVHVYDKSSKLALAPPPGLADSFWLEAPVPEDNNNRIRGRDQKLTSLTLNDGKMILEWAGPLLDTGKRAHDISVQMEISLDGQRAEFGLSLSNHSKSIVKHVCYPLMGGLSRIYAGRDGAETRVLFPTTSTTTITLNDSFTESTPAYPGQMNMSYCDVYNTKSDRSIYFASHDKIARYKTYHFVRQSDGVDTDIFAYIQHFPFAKPGADFEGSDVVVCFHDGDWQAAGPIYRKWFKDTFGLRDPSQCWIRNQSFFLDTMFLLPEGNINYTFKDIRRWAKSAKDHGVNAVMISGWHRGGHDNGYPYYEPDRRLGTWEELEEGIRACHEMGLKVYFFVNYQPVNLDTEWYNRELKDYLELDANGVSIKAGWGMGTLDARMGHPRIMSWADPSIPRYQDILVKAFTKLAQIGADGIHVDKMYPTAMNYNPRCALSPDAGPWEGAMQLTKRIFTECSKIRPDWAMSFECNWDRVLTYGSAVWWVGNMSFVRTVFPELAETLAIMTPYDYLGVNNAVLMGHVVLLAPLNCSRSLDWEPWQGLSDYVKEVKRIQDSLAEVVFLGESLGQEGVQVAGEIECGVKYNVYRGLTSGNRVCIFTNSENELHKQLLEQFVDGSSSRVRVYTPFKKTVEVTLPAQIEIPAERIVFVEELRGKHENTAMSDNRHREPKRSSTTPLATEIPNGGFECGDFRGWTASENWTVAANSCGGYLGWSGRYFAWSGGKGEAGTGVLKSANFILDQSTVTVLCAGWSNPPNSPAKQCYVALHLADGKEIDRKSAPNTVSFVPLLLDGSEYVGKEVYILAVDNADHQTFSMIAIDFIKPMAQPVGMTMPLPALPTFDERKSLRLENDFYQLEVSKENGSITRIYDKRGNLDLIREPRLAGCFQFTLPLPGKEPWQSIDANYIISNQQRPTSSRIVDHRLELRWDEMKNYLGEKYDVAADVAIELVGQDIKLSWRIDNSTPYGIGETYFPILGGMTGLGQTGSDLKATEFVRPVGDQVARSNIFHVFGNMSPLGAQGAEQYYSYPNGCSQPWFAFSSPQHKRSVYIGAHDRADRKLVIRLEMWPGISDTVRSDGNWPRRNELGDLPAGVLASIVDFVRSEPGKNYEAAPIVIRFIDGDPQKGQSIYNQWEMNN